MQPGFSNLAFGVLYLGRWVMSNKKSEIIFKFWRNYALQTVNEKEEKYLFAGFSNEGYLLQNCL